MWRCLPMHVCVQMPKGQRSKRTKVVKTQSHPTKRAYTAYLSATYHAYEMEVRVVWSIIMSNVSGERCLRANLSVETSR